ncbi:C6 zinc finger domain-containing protein [Trichophyton interdigitale]|uniref:C6 finger domain transcription factor nscR n=1 Tax=Trichophyton interdigitale TaxID=101480 RepID=A0A9P5CWU1_9EURO|nr:C6 zinc finger domain-containing protein [Trichophyton interdigitale]KAF3893675.1 C6 zinc finger domain-containing protein [Trichophyton interdigitale]KAG8207041.1 C6 zinc finger domain-containing protein [Trichophyton interdigitale]
MSSTTTHTSKRLPVSCEPCRKRKIRCPRNGPPCDTCIRRGLGMADCFFLGQSRNQLNASSAESSKIVQQELLQRIRNLEDLLKKHVGAHAIVGGGQAGQDEPVSPPTTNASAGTEADCGSNKSFSNSNNKHNNNNDNNSSDLPQSLLQNVGSLSISPQGHVRFEPQSSKLDFHLAQISASEYRNQVNSVNEEKPSGFPFGCDDPASRDRLLARLPPSRYCDALKDTYFRVFSPLFHILHDPTFAEEYERFRQDPSSVSLSWLALLFVVLAIGVTSLSDDDPLLPDLGREATPSANIRVISEQYRSAAMQCLAADQVLSRHSMKTLQALVLLIYALTHSSQPSWVLIGMTHHVAIAMGCHLDPDNFNLSLVEAEERRRCWAGLIMLHMIQKISFRNLDRQRLSRDVRLPLDANDLDLMKNSGLTMDQLRHPTGPTQMTYLLFKFRLYDIALAICNEIFSSEASPAVIAKLDNDITSQQELWSARYHSDTSVEPLPSQHFAHINILFGYSHQLRLLLHRPALNRYLTGDINDRTHSSRNRCLDAAKGLLSIQKTLAESPQYAPYKWYTAGLASFHAFHAAVVLTVIMMNPESQEEYDEIHALLVDALQVFHLLSSRSSLCEKGIPILSQLLEMASPQPQHLSIPQQQQPSQSELMSTAVPSPQDTPISLLTHGGSVSEPTFDFANTHAETIQSQLQAQYWVTASSIPWNSWGFLIHQV